MELKIVIIQDDEIRSEAYLRLAETILLALMKVQVKDEFSVRPASYLSLKLIQISKNSFYVDLFVNQKVVFIQKIVSSKIGATFHS